MNAESIYRITLGVHVRKEDFGLLVISKSTPALALNHDIMRVWELIDGIRSLEEVCSIISEEYEGTDITTQIHDIYKNLASLSLIEPVS